MASSRIATNDRGYEVGVYDPDMKAFEEKPSTI
jgi:hypothetical protein